MTYTRKTPDLRELRDAAAITTVNEIIGALAAGGHLVHYKYDSTQLITTADASSLGTSKTLAKALALAIPVHGADAEVHSVADVIAQAAAWASAPAEPANLTEVQNTLNEIKGDINTHVANATPHRSKWGTVGVDGVITAKAITTADASDQSTANALANAIKAFYNAHLKSAASEIELTAS
jgi:hypothetical protein